MKVVFITPLTPYKENYRGASGLPYHLLRNRPNGVDATLYTFNSNHLSADKIREVEQELNIPIKLLKESWWRVWMFRLHLSFIRILLKYPINNYRRLRQREVEEIKALKPDLIWGYSQEFSRIMKQFPECKRLHTLPDCYSLHFYRRLGLRGTMIPWLERWNVMVNYIKHYRMERGYDTASNVTYHLVGEEDRIFLHEINPVLDAHFLRHPHYELAPRREIQFHEPKLRLLVAGRYDLYSRQLADELVECLVSYPQHHPSRGERDLRNCYTITFLGKGWERHVVTLATAGYEVKHITFAPDYIEEITHHDIQLNPLTIGTGTKGKVLDALANGLLVLGTRFALENIAVEHGKSCIEWTHAEEVPEILLDIAAHREHYERIAEAGREAVLREHNPAKVSDELFKMVTL